MDRVKEAGADGDCVKICVPTMGTDGMKEAVSQHFGQAPTFTIVDIETGDVQVMPNQSSHMGGTGLPTEAILASGVRIVIVGGLGPKAVTMFAQSGVEVFVGAVGAVDDAIQDWKDGLLMRASLENACSEHRH